jgi:hypothetical protein
MAVEEKGTVEVMKCARQEKMRFGEELQKLI